MIKHNKKRNTLLLYEFLVQSLVNSILQNDKKQTNITKKVIKEHFKKGTQLYKEYRLMRGLATITTKSDSTIEKIFNDVKTFSKNIDTKALNKEKTKLINEIHNKVTDNSFYKYDVKDYIKYATIQNLINEYSNSHNNDFESHIKISIFEDKIKSAIISEEEYDDSEIKIEDKKIYNNITTRLIVEKFNEKYKLLNDVQRAIIVSHGLKNIDEMNSIITEALTLINNKIDSIKRDQEIENDNKLTEKLKNVEKIIRSIDINNIDGHTIFKTITCAEILNYED